MNYEEEEYHTYLGKGTLQILKEVEALKNFTRRLKESSKYYPKILKKEYKGTVYLSTLVRIKRKRKYYYAHCIESFVPTTITTIEDCLLKMMHTAYLTQYLYKVTKKFEDVDELQESEAERLVKTYMPKKKKR